MAGRLLKKLKRNLRIVTRPKFSEKTVWSRDEAWMARFERHLAYDSLGGREHPHRILDRRYTLTSFAKAVAHLTGDSAECGVLRGTGSALICETLRDTYGEQGHHWAFDSFEGLPEPGTDDGRWAKGSLAISDEKARKSLAEFSFAKIIPGWFPDTFEAVKDRTFRLVHIDVDIEKPTLDCLEFFYPRAVAGALFIIDDYGLCSCPGARRSVDTFLSDKPETLIELTTGQGVFFRDSSARL